MATLDNVVNQLKENKVSQLGTESALLKLIELQEKAVGNELKSEEARREAAKKPLGSSIAGGRSGGGAIGGLGAQLGGLGAGLAKFGLGSVAGMGALGLALPAFFGGLLLGEQALSGAVNWMGGNFNFDAIGNAVEGFSGIVGKMDEGALIALAGLMAVTGFSRNPVQGAIALAAMGAAIPAFFGGLLIGNGVLAGMEWIGFDFDFAATGRVVEGFSGMIANLTPAAAIALGALLTAGTLASLKGLNPLKTAQTMAVVGAAIPALMGGLVIGNGVLAGAEWLGVSLDFAALSTSFAGFSTAIGSLTSDAVVALGGILVASGVGAAFGVGTRTLVSTAAIATGIGASISGLFIGLALGDTALSWITQFQGQGGGLASVFGVFNDSVSILSDTAMTALAVLVGSGSAIGAVIGTVGTPVAAAAAAAGIFAIMTGIGAGISGLMIGLGLGDTALSWIQGLKREGGGMTAAFEGFNDMMLAITPEAVDRMAAISSRNIGTGLSSLAVGMIGFLTATGMSEIGNTWSTIKGGLQGMTNFLFGTSFGEEREPSAIEKIVEGLGGLEALDDNMIERMDTFGAALERFMGAFTNLGNFDSGSGSRNLAKMVEDTGGVLTMIDYLLKGGTMYTEESNALSRLLGTGRGEINFGPGLNNIEMGDLESMSGGIEALRTALGVSSNSDLQTQVATPSFSLPDTLQNLYVENLILRNSGQQPIIYQDNSSTSNSMSNGSSNGGRTSAPVGVDAARVLRDQLISAGAG